MTARKRPRVRSGAINRARREGYAAGVANEPPAHDHSALLLSLAWLRSWDRGQAAVKTQVATVLEGVFARTRGGA